MTTSATTHVVVHGDTLWDLAKKYYGTGTKWHVVHDANAKLLPDPDMLKPGEVLTIPAG
jgi:nucleoid-associated protein YgaU